jgi:hypothetical protein
VNVTVGGSVSEAVGVGVSDGYGVGEGVVVGVGVIVTGAGVGVVVSVGVIVGVAGVYKVAVTKIGVKDGTNIVAASAVSVAGCTQSGVMVGDSGCGPPANRTRAKPVQ